MNEQEQKEYIMEYLSSIANKDIETLMQAKANFVKEMAIRKETISEDNFEILTMGISKILEERINNDIKKNKNLEMSDYFHDPKYYLKNSNLKEECELGNISYLLKNAPSKLQDFLKERYNFDEQDIAKIQNSGIKLSGGKKGPGISLYRNKAAHPGIMTYAEAKEAKRHIFPSCSKKCNKCDIPDFKCLLLELLGILKLKS